ncbi:Glycerol-1-phosphate dehydrogenase [NAD(P)+] [archaeon HR01]|nr:Glycerol-1-phosphate dehydrogenase [NAD(P)+] [archaeon HR01]
MEQFHAMELPHYIIVGEKLSDKVVERLRIGGFRNALIITSPTPYRLMASKIESEAHNAIDVEVCVLGEYGKLLNGLESGRYDVVLGVGGGRVIDTAKAVAETVNVPLFSIPTVASHDGIASPMTSIRTGGKAYSRKSVMPSVIIADMSVISLAPRRYAVSGCGDLIAKYSAVRDWWLGHLSSGEYYGRYAAHLAYLSAAVIIKSSRKISRMDLDGVRTIVEALISAGVSMGIAGSSRPCSGSEHLIAHSLEHLMDSPPLHGERCGVATVFTSYLHGSNWRRIAESLRGLGAPSTLNELGVDTDIFTEAVIKAPTIRPERYTVLNRVKLDRKRILDILQETGLA